MGLITVSGCPRSGTSLMMNILISMIGDKTLLGKKFPMEKDLILATTQQPDESDEYFKVRKYTLEKTGLIESLQNKFNKTKELNPNGFWEDRRFSVKGLYHNLETKDLIKDIRNNSNKKYFCKIVSQGLNNTDPYLINKMIYMVRNPQEVAKSQENLNRDSNFMYNGELVNIYEGIEVNTPQMYIEVTVAAAIYFEENDIDVMFINYENLMSNPEKIINEIGNFIKVKPKKKTIDIIDSSLYRSKNYKEPSGDLWKDANIVYELFLQKDFEGIKSKFTTDFKNTELSKLHVSWHCVRTNRRMVQSHCESCIKGSSLTKSLKQKAIHEKINWEKEPCVYECAYRNTDLISMQESIEKNNWKKV